MRSAPPHLPGKAWSTILCGMLINLCLVALYAWSVWRPFLVGKQPTSGLITNAQAADIFVIACIMFGLGALPAGLLTDLIGARLPAMVGGLLFGTGLIFTSLTLAKAPNVALILGFSILGGLGMGMAMGATVPGALKWARQHFTGFVAGLVVCTYGFIALFGAPFTNWLIEATSLANSFLVYGLVCGPLIALAAIGLCRPGPDYIAPAGVSLGRFGQPPPPTVDRTLSEIFTSPQCYLLLVLFPIGVMAGLTFVSQLASLMFRQFRSSIDLIMPLIMAAGLTNAVSRPTLGLLSDITGRHVLLIILYAGAALSAFLVALCIKMSLLAPLILIYFMSYCFYGSLFALFPALLVDFFGTRHLGLIYGLLFFLGFGLGFPLFQLITSTLGESFATGGVISRHTFNFLFMGVLCLVGVALVVVSLILRRSPTPLPGRQLYPPWPGPPR